MLLGVQAEAKIGIRINIREKSFIIALDYTERETGNCHRVAETPRKIKDFGSLCLGDKTLILHFERNVRERKFF